MRLFNLFGNQNETVTELLENGAVIIDVRSSQEYAGGHVKGSINMPLNTITNKIGKIKKMNRAVITCCASGARSGSAASVLKRNNIEVVNGGAWTNVNKMKLRN